MNVGLMEGSGGSASAVAQRGSHMAIGSLRSPPGQGRLYLPQDLQVRVVWDFPGRLWGLLPVEVLEGEWEFPKEST